MDFDDRQIYVSTTTPVVAPGGGGYRVGDAFGLLGGSVASLTSGFAGDNVDSTFHDLKFNETRGNELIPRTAIPKQQVYFLGILTSLFLVLGLCPSYSQPSIPYLFIY